MKKIFTLVTGLLMAVALMAADRRPVVTVKSMKNYKIVIDGRTYFTNNSRLRVPYMQSGWHSIQVFEMRRGYFFRRERLVSSERFILRNHDVDITINYFGKVQIREDRDFGRFDHDDRDRGRWDDKGRDNRGRDRDMDRRGSDDRRF